MSNFVPCRIAKLPPHQIVRAARTAVEMNPANAPAKAELAPLPTDDGETEMPHILRLALLTSKYWGAGGVKLGVSFLDDPPPSVRSRILAHANAWGERANVRFSESAQGEVRLARIAGEGYWSYLGTDILHVEGPTMNLDSFSDDTPESEYMRVVRHEFGHTLGWPHEHQRRQIIARLDPQKTIDYFSRSQGWSAGEVQQQVLTPLDEASLTATPDADQVSIMCYALPPEITVDGQLIPGGLDIDESDHALAAKLYPKSVTSPPPEPPPPAGVTLEQITDCDENVFAHLQTAFARVRGAKSALTAAKTVLESEHAALFQPHAQRLTASQWAKLVSDIAALVAKLLGG